MSKFAQFSSKTAHTNGCSNVYICTLAIVTVQICTVTVAMHNNNLLFFLSHHSVPLFPNRDNKEEEDKPLTIINSAPPNNQAKQKSS